MSLTEEYKKMFARQTREQDNLAKKYAKHKVGSKVTLEEKEYIVSAVFPEEQNDDTVEVMYVLRRQNEKDVWILESEL